MCVFHTKNIYNILLIVVSIVFMVFENYEIYYNNITMYIQKYTTNILLTKEEITLSQHWKHYYSFNFISSTKNMYLTRKLYVYPLYLKHFIIYFMQLQCVNGLPMCCKRFGYNECFWTITGTGKVTSITEQAYIRYMFILGECRWFYKFCK